MWKVYRIFCIANDCQILKFRRAHPVNHWLVLCPIPCKICLWGLSFGTDWYDILISRKVEKMKLIESIARFLISRYILHLRRSAKY